MVVKTDSRREVEWAQIIGATGTDQTKRVVETSDGNFVVCAFSTSFPSLSYSILLINIDPSGNIVWTRSAAAEGSNWP